MSIRGPVAIGVLVEVRLNRNPFVRGVLRVQRDIAEANVGEVTVTLTTAPRTDESSREWAKPWGQPPF